MKTWAQYLWHGHRNQWLLFVAMLSIPLASPIVHYFDSEQAYLIFSTVGLLYIAACFAAMSISVIQEFSSNERLQLTPNMLRSTRHFLLILNIAFLCAALLLCLIHSYETWLTILVAWAVLTGLLTCQFLSPSKALAIAIQILFIIPFFVIGFQFQLPHVHHYYFAPTIITIGVCYFLLIKGRRRPNIHIDIQWKNYRQPTSISPLHYSSPNILFRLFGLFGLQQQMLTFWVSAMALLYIGIIICLYLDPDRVNVLLIMTTLGATLITALLPLISEKAQVKSIAPWAIMPITNSRLHFSQQFMNGAFLSHLKLLIPFYLLLIWVPASEKGFALALAFIGLSVSLLCVGIAWLSIAKQWREIAPAIVISLLIIAPTPWLASILSDQLIAIAAVSTLICALAFWLYKLAYRSLALVDWH